MIIYDSILIKLGCLQPHPKDLSFFAQSTGIPNFIESVQPTFITAEAFDPCDFDHQLTTVS